MWGTDMRNAVGAVLTACLLALSAPAAAQDLKTGIAAFQNRDFAAALREIKPLAEQGDPLASHLLGMMYLEGFGVTPDRRKAVEWYRRAAETGDAGAAFILTFIYEPKRGVGSPAEWRRILQPLGCDEARVQRVMQMRQAIENAWYGDAEVQFQAGLGFEEGHSVPQSHSEAARWYRRAVREGYSRALTRLGLLYVRGQGVAQNADKGLKLLQQAADKRDSEAHLNLGLLYEEGQAVEQNLVLAHMWFTLAVRHAHHKAVDARNKVAKKMTPEQLAKAEKLYRQWMGE